MARLEVRLVLDYLKNSLQTIEQNTQIINNGISNGSKNGNAIAASISPTKARMPRIIKPTPAKTKAKSIATQNRMTSVNMKPHAPIRAPKGPVISRPFMMIDTPSPPIYNAQARNTIINTAKIKANLRITAGLLFVWFVRH
jgi:hypothetical protein